MEASCVLGAQIDCRPGDRTSCGDFAEHLYLDRFRTAVFVGDVAGRGPAVGRAADALRACVRSALLKGTPLPNCLDAADRFFARSLISETVPFASLFIAIGDGPQATLRYASAGHEPGLLFDEAGSHRHLDPTGPVLGIRSMLARSAFGERKICLGDGGLLVIVTDGITEARRAEGNGLTFFGSAGVARAVRDARLRRQDTADAIHRAALEHARGAQCDDASVAVSTFGIRPGPSPAMAARRPLEGWAALSKAEQRVAGLIASGYSNRSVAAELVLAQSTIATHARSIYGKLGVNSRVQLALAVMDVRSPTSRPVQKAG
jgi:DNA-binding CsgD family transcriptional regulator